MLTIERADHFAAEWIAAWNAHDLDRILAHWAEPCTFTSPLVTKLVGDPTGTVHGKAALRAYWTRGLAANPDLHFTFEQVLVGHDSLVIAYRNHRGQRAGEWLRLDDDDRAIAGVAHYR